MGHPEEAFKVVVGWCLARNYVQGHMSYNLAASNEFISEYREEAVKDRNQVAKAMTPEAIIEAQRLASEWKKKGSGN